MVSVGSLDIWWFEAEAPLIQRFRFESEDDECFFHFQTKSLVAFTGLRELQIICQDAVTHWITVAEETYFPTENVLFISQGPGNTHAYSRQSLLEMYSSRPLAEYSNSYYRQMYDNRIKGTVEDAPDELFFGTLSGEGRIV